MAEILSLAEARAAIQLPANDTSKDAQLTDPYIPAVTAVVEDLIGPVMQATRTVTADGGGGSVVLPTGAVTSVTSVTDSGVALVSGDYTVDLAAGVVYRGSATTPIIYTPGRQTVTIIYVAGAYIDPANVPANIRLAARIILAHLWQADRQGFRPDYGGPDSSVVTSPSGYAVPRRAVELLGKTAAAPLGFA